MIFHNPLVLLLLPPTLFLLFYKRGKREAPSLIFPSAALFFGMKETLKIKVFRNTIYIRALAVVCIILALARPQFVTEETTIITEGIDIALAVDVSTSMLAEDLATESKRENRITIAKKVIAAFITARESDRIGLVAFAARAYAISPLTFDHEWLHQNLGRVDVGMIEDGTAVGDGIVSALNVLKGSDAGGKIAILLTDGRNNAGDIRPDVAAEAARALSIKIYTIGIGAKGKALFPVSDPFGKILLKPVAVEPDEAMLRRIAEKTGAAHFRATDAVSLAKIYETIDRLEKRPLQQKVYYQKQELFPLFIIPCLMLLLLEFAVKNLLIRRVP